MFVNNAYGAYGVQPTAAPTPNGNATGQSKPSFMERLKDKFSSMGMAMGFGPAAREIKQAFRGFDQNKSKDLDVNEFGAVSAALMTGADSMARADGNGNGKVTLGEFKSWVRATSLSEFRSLDTNGSSSIDGNEFQAMAARNPGLQMKGIDTSGDGMITFREYLRFRVGTMPKH